jgi:hypothetical protein
MIDLPLKYFLLFSFLVCIGFGALAQTDSTAVSQDTTYTLVGNTLLTNQGFKIVVGQPIIIGEAAGEQGWYQTIIFRNPTAWPILLFRDIELKNNMEYQLDESIRTKNKIRDILTKGDTLTVTRIKRFGRSRNTWYVVWLRLDQGLLSVNLRCYIKDAIRLREIIVPKE